MPGTKVSEDAGSAFAAGKSFSRGAWCVNRGLQPFWPDRSGWTESVWLSLHGNTITRRKLISNDEVLIWTQGFVTPTTIRGINAVLKAMDMPWRACIKKCQAMVYSIGTGNQIMLPLVEGMKLTHSVESGMAPAIGGQ